MGTTTGNDSFYDGCGTAWTLKAGVRMHELGVRGYIDSQDEHGRTTLWEGKVVELDSADTADSLALGIEMARVNDALTTPGPGMKAVLVRYGIEREEGAEATFPMLRVYRLARNRAAKEMARGRRPADWFGAMAYDAGRRQGLRELAQAMPEQQAKVQVDDADAEAEYLYEHFGRDV